MVPDVVTVIKFLLWLRRLGVAITIAPFIDREDDKVYKTEEDMVDLAARWHESKGK